MATSIKQINGAMAFYETEYPWRLYEAIGPEVVRYVSHFSSQAHDDTTNEPLEWEITKTGASSSMVLTDEAGGVMLLTTGASSGNGMNMQLGHTDGESVILDGSYPLYFEVDFSLADATQTTFIAGVGVTDTNWTTGITDGIYFRKPDDSNLLWFVSEKNSTEYARHVHTMVANEYVLAEIWFDGEFVNAYINGLLQARFAIAKETSAFPNDELMRLTLEFKSGSVGAKRAKLHSLTMLHFRGGSR